MAKARRGEEICVPAIGGSITAGGLQTKDPKNRYIARVADWFTQTFPEAKVMQALAARTRSAVRCACKEMC